MNFMAGLVKCAFLMGGFNWTDSCLGKLLPERHRVGGQMVIAEEQREKKIWLNYYMGYAERKESALWFGGNCFLLHMYILSKVSVVFNCDVTRLNWRALEGLPESRGYSSLADVAQITGSICSWIPCWIPCWIASVLLVPHSFLDGIISSLVGIAE